MPVASIREYTILHILAVVTSATLTNPRKSTKQARKDSREKIGNALMSAILL